MTDAAESQWVIVKTPDQACDIVPLTPETFSDPKSYWGQFTSYEEAITHRVGLIRAGKCRPK